MRPSTLTAVAAAVLFTGSAVCDSRASSTSIRVVPVVLANEHGVSGAVATANDPNLANRILHTISVNVPAGQDWTNSEIRVVLTSGTIYNAASTAGGTDGAPNPVLWTAAPAFSPGAYDTFVNSKGVTAATILGKLNPDHTGGEPPAEGLTQNNAQVMSVAWGNTVGGEDGTFQIGQFTVSADATGTFFGRTYSTDQTTTPFHTFQGLVGLIPEPTGLAGVLVGAAGLLRRRPRGAARRR